MDSSPRRAFTLPDAVAATGCLAAITVVSAASLTGASRADLTAQDQANLMTIGAAAAAWSADHQGLIPGAPGASARELLNDPAAKGRAASSIYTKGLATQPFDWASPLAWGYLSDAEPPERRDIRLAYALGVEPKLVDPDAEEPVVASAPLPGPLEVFSDPAQTHLSIPYDDGSHQPSGLEGTYFAVQTATSYAAAREFLWWGQETTAPRWANQEAGSFWGSAGNFTMNNAWSIRLPGSLPTGQNAAASPARPYRPYVNRVGNPSQKIFLANGTRYQSAIYSGIDHDISAQAGYGGAFADTGAWASAPESPGVSRAWADGLNAAGEEISRISFRHGDQTTARGNILFYDSSVRLTEIEDARDPALWLPRGTSLSLNDIPEAYRDSFSNHVEHLGGPYPFLARIIIW